MKLKFRFVFKQGPKVIASFEGRELGLEELTVDDVERRIIETENFIEKITGVRCHIEQMN